MKRLKPIKHSCSKCHFLAWGVNQVSIKPTTWDDDLRARLEPLSEGGRYRSGCNKGYWHESFLPQDDNGQTEIKAFQDQVRKDRKESCFFVEYQEGMTWEAAEDLQRLQYENRNLKRSLLIATWGLYISAVAAVFNFIGFDNFAKAYKCVVNWTTLFLFG